MLTSTLLRRSIVPLVALLLMVGCGRRTATTTPLLGYVDDTTLETLLKVTDAKGVRIYNVRSSSSAASTSLTVAINGAGCELVGEGEKGYYAYRALSGGGASTDVLDRATAKRWVANEAAAGVEVVAAVYHADEVRELLREMGANGIRVETATTPAGLLTKGIGPVKIADGSATDLSTGLRLCAEPCPSFCGADPSCYLHRE